MPQSAVDKIIEKTIAYLDVPSVVGHESPFMEYMAEEGRAAGLTVRMHPGLVEMHGRQPQAATLCAHLDRHGLISLGRGEYVYAAQYMKEIKYGENNRASVRELEGIIQRFAGESVYAYDPATGLHLGESGLIHSCERCMGSGDAVFEVSGVSPLPLNIPLAYARRARVEGDCLVGQLDNAVSLATIMVLFESGFEGTALLSTEEEIGKSWLHLSNYLDNFGIESRDLLVLDTSPFANATAMERGKVIFRHRDMSAHFNTALVLRLIDRATARDIPCLVKDEYLLAEGKTVEQLGSTELGKLILRTVDRWSGATIQIPTTMYHTSHETTSRQAIKNYYGFLKDILIDAPMPLAFKIADRT